jgi:hypothetical protein
MNRALKSARPVTAFLAVAIVIANGVAAQSLSTLTGITPEMVAPLLTPLIADAVPREFEGQKDWGKTAKIISGLHSNGNFFKFDIHRETTEVNDGVWKKYRITLVEPEKNLQIRIENMHRLESGKYALTLFVAAKMHAWARAVVYEHGVHIISLEAEGDTSIRLWTDAEVAVETVKSSTFIPGVQLTPVVTDAKLKFDDFKLQRISDLHGKIANELGDLLRKELQKKLSGPKLAERFNHALQKHPEKLRLSPDILLGKAPSKKKSS